MSFFLSVVAVLGQMGLSFYAFWLVWRVLLPDLPGPADPEKRIAPFAAYFTDPFVQPLAKVLRIPPRVAALAALTIVAIGSAGLGRLSQIST